MSKKYGENIVTYTNDENLKQIPTTEKRISFKNLRKKITTGISGLAAFLATHNVMIFLGNQGEDKVIRFLQNWQTIFTNGSMKPNIPPNEFLANVFKVAGNIVSVSWATLMAYPEVFSAVVGGLAAMGAIAIFKVADKIKFKNNSGQVKSNSRSLK